MLMLMPIYVLRLMLMLMHKWEQRKTNKWVRSSYVSAYAYAYTLVRTNFKPSWRAG